MVLCPLSNEPEKTHKKIDPMRLELVEQMYRDNRTAREIQHAVVAQFKTTSRTARRYIEIVKKRLAKDCKRSPGAARARFEETALRIQRLAEEKGRLALALRAAERIAVICGAAAPKRVRHSGPGGGPIAVAGAVTAPVIFIPPESNE
jgi:predicted ATP-dependent protease